MPRNETATERARRLRREATPTESALWQRLRRRQVGGVKFRPQHCLTDDLYADFCCIEERRVVEVDGVHHAQPSYEEADERRTQRLRADGYQVMRAMKRWWETRTGLCMRSRRPVMSSASAPISPSTNLGTVKGLPKETRRHAAAQPKPGRISMPRGGPRGAKSLS